MNGELIEALKQLEREKQIDPNTVLEALMTALAAAYKRNYTSPTEIRVDINPQSGKISVFSQTWTERDGEEPELLEEEVTPDNFGRIAAQTAKQVILQRIREAEREKMYMEYIDREGDIVTGIVEQSDQRYTLVNLGRVEALLPPTEQVPTERYDHGTRLKTYIVEVRRTTKEPQIIVSRTHPSLLRRLFELEVPEIYEGYVEIKSVAREPGYRSKIAVSSRDSSIDPVGACVGPKGSRVRMVVSELRGEKIDVVEWNEDPAKFVSNSLSPAKVKDVKVNETEHTAEVIVPDNQLSLAIGKEGQNARLAAKLTGWRIDIRSESQAKDSAEKTMVFEVPVDDVPVSEPIDLEEGTLQTSEVTGISKPNDDSETCCAVKSSGERCTNKARPGSDYCGVHKNMESK
ncbi:MAG: transcription termination/antitermination protein NusA [Rubrobacteridae bacterium]|nr:transcription termination/antitermination protein NusA [Rubrobacteridae bacterium]